MSPAKRWMCVAIPVSGGWRVGLERVGALDRLLPRLGLLAEGAPVAIGFDAPIGLPHFFEAGHFPSFLRALDPADRFFTVCNEISEISREQPFYPRLPRAGMRRRDLLERLGLADGAELLRQCEERLGIQPAASPMFWTLGANQVGKGALRLWQELLLPALRGDEPPWLWPFDGALAGLLQPGRFVIAETYPANAMRQMELGMRGSKRRQSDRAAVADRFRALLLALRAEPDGDLAGQIASGFGSGADGEDRFDSLIGLIRMLQVDP